MGDSQPASQKVSINDAPLPRCTVEKESNSTTPLPAGGVVTAPDEDMGKGQAWQAVEKGPSAALHASLVIAADQESCLIPQGFVRLASGPS